ncbi:hypothetical protein MALV_25530 [Mycolicibacterium alvei]|uniref:non-specific serine/threonine protein kinase n=2 Tax=Mycolicibacterium alvei TaxID=67081 RepID=A0A6N4USM7_9MYCO|nr:hypothetical protein MALV_25530 [Mycolicibacterium alvei]
MGEVYLAQHPRLPRPDALKVLRPEASLDEDFRQRFIREADLAARLTHPNIVTVHDRGEFNGQLWIASQYVDGIDAARMLHDSYPDGMPANLASAIISAIANALDYAHEQNLLHRDVKPANILLSHPDRSGRHRAYLADFGIARSLTEANGLTATNMTVGTFAYSAPEQLLGEGVGDQADQYALAATAYHLLTGSHLYPSSNAAAVINHQVNSIPPSLSEKRPELAKLDPILQMGLAKRAGDRFLRCVDFADALADHIDSPGAPGPVDPTIAAARPTVEPAPYGLLAKQPARDRKVRRTRILVATVMTGVVVAVGAFLAGRPWQSGDVEGAHPSEVTGSSVAASPKPANAHAAAAAIQAAVPQVTSIVDLNEDTDANHLLGRPNGYSAATVLIDSRADCDTGSPGASCGATIEQWPDETAARRRSDYLQQIHSSVPILGTEWTTVKGGLLLRVSGDLPASAAKVYEAAFGAESTNSVTTAAVPNSKEALEIRAHQLDVFASRGNAAAAYEFYSQRCKQTLGDLDSYNAFLNEWLKGRKPQYAGVTVKVNGSSAQVVSIDNDPNTPASSMNPRTWTFIDGAWQFDNC